MFLLTLTLLGAAAASPRSQAAGDPASEAARPPVERRIAAMGSWLEIHVELGSRTRDEALAASERALQALLAVERRLSTWAVDSELAQLNAAPVDEWRALSAPLAAELELARFWSEETEGAFDPALGGLVQLWGLRSGGGVRPDAAHIARCLEGVGARAFELNGGRARRRHELALFEEGGFGKGLGLDAACLALRAAGFEHAWLNLGGQLALCGADEEHHFALADPRDRSQALLELRIGRGSLATSGNSERGIVCAGERLGHLLDPRSGLPAPDFGSLTVWAPDAASADCLSTGLYVLGPERALAFAEAHAGIEVLVIESLGPRVRASSGFAGRLVPSSSALRIELASAPPPRPAPDSGEREAPDR